MKWVLTMLVMLPYLATAQTEDEFLPEIRLMVIDSTEHAVQKFCKEVVGQVPSYKSAFVDREEVMSSTYFYDNNNYESLKLNFQFGVSQVMLKDSTYRKMRLVKMVRITAELSVMTDIYNYIFMTGHTPEKVMTISRYDKAVTFNGTPINSTLVADDFKAGYWILSFYKL